MDIAVFSDVHGNYVALEACVADARKRGIQTFIFLGDYVGELAYPQRAMDMIYDIREKYECYFIRGNKEDYWQKYVAGGKQGWKEYDSTTGMLLYAYRRMRKKDLTFFNSLPTKQEMQFKDYPRMTICHGSPYSASEKILPEDQRSHEILVANEADYILCGHTHQQYKVTYRNKTALNPGSVGLPFHSGGKAQFMILHGEPGVWREEFISLTYDVDKVIRELDEEGLDILAPGWTRMTKHVLPGGEISHATALTHAMELCKQEKGYCNWPEIPEKFWQQALQDLL